MSCRYYLPPPPIDWLQTAGAGCISSTYTFPHNPIISFNLFFQFAPCCKFKFSYLSSRTYLNIFEVSLNLSWRNCTWEIMIFMQKHNHPFHELCMQLKLTVQCFIVRSILKKWNPLWWLLSVLYCSIIVFVWCVWGGPQPIAGIFFKFTLTRSH